MSLEKIAQEVRRLLLYAAFFFLFFSAFTIYRRLIVGEELVSYIHFGYNLVESLVLSKIILLGQYFRLGERFSGKPLIVPTLYKTLIFTFFVMLFDVLERFVLGFFQHRPLESIYQKLQGEGAEEIAAELFVMAFVFVFFFALSEIDKELFGEKLFDKFFKDRT